MKISTILDHIDNGHIALPEFQRGYVWNRDQVRSLFDSLYRHHPVGGLLVWTTEAQSATHRGDAQLAGGVVKLLLDGQQRITSLYGVLRGRAPKFFDGNAQAFTGLYFDLESESFEFYQAMKMAGRAEWVDVTKLMKKGMGGVAEFVALLSASPSLVPHIGEYVTRLSRLLGIVDIDFYVEEITGDDMKLDVVVDIFNRVNSGGTKLSRGDLALAKICADWPEARKTMRDKLAQWSVSGYHFNLDWLLRSVNTVLTGEAKFHHLHNRRHDEIENALRRAIKHIDTCLNIIAAHLGLDHDRVFFGRYAIPLMVRYLDRYPGQPDAKDLHKLLFWYAQAGMWGRYSSSTESSLDQDLALLEKPEEPLSALLEQLSLWHGGLRVEPGHFTGSSLGARFYPVLYMLTRMSSARDWGLGIPLKAGMLGVGSKLEVHHIFPKAQLYKAHYKRPEVNALANFCFLTKDTNLKISDRLPEKYFPEIEAKHPGALASQWIPSEPELWKLRNFRDFLEARKTLLADAVNEQLGQLLHGELHWLQARTAVAPVSRGVLGGITSDDEETELEGLRLWMEQQSLPPGELSFDLSDPNSGEQLAVLDLAWPEGVQAYLSEPVAVLLNETAETLSLASAAGLRCFTSIEGFKHYINTQILGNP